MNKFQIGDHVTSEVTPGIGTILDIKNPKYHNKRFPGPYYLIRFPNYPEIWHPENEIKLVKPVEPTPPTYQPE